MKIFAKSFFSIYFAALPAGFLALIGQRLGWIPLTGPAQWWIFFLLLAIAFPFAWRTLGDLGHNG